MTSGFKLRARGPAQPQPAELFPVEAQEGELRCEEAAAAGGEGAPEVPPEVVPPGRRSGFRCAVHRTTYTRGAVVEFRGSGYINATAKKGVYGAKEQRAAEDGDPTDLVEERLGVPDAGARGQNLPAPVPRRSPEDAAQDRRVREGFGR